jgi:AcrR family transcriptional regulator
MGDVPPRQRLLDAAAEVAEDAGVTGLTLEAVAERAGVSKGGLLHYFPSKAALLAGMVADIVGRYYAEVDADGYVAASAKSAATARRWTAVLTASLLEPALLDALREPARERWSAALGEAADPVDAAIAWLAADGLWLSDMLGLYELDPEVRERLVGRLTRLAQPSTGTSSGNGTSSGVRPSPVSSQDV